MHLYTETQRLEKINIKVWAAHQPQNNVAKLANWALICKVVKVKLLSHVWLFVTPWIVAYHAPPSMGFSRLEYWSGLPFPSPGISKEIAIKFQWLLEIVVLLSGSISNTQKHTLNISPLKDSWLRTRGVEGIRISSNLREKKNSSGMI